MLASDARRLGIADRRLRRINWTGAIVNTEAPRPDRSVGRVLDRPVRNYRVILRGPMRGKKVSLFPRSLGASSVALSQSSLTRPDRANAYRRHVREAFNGRMTQLAERLAQLRKEFELL